MTSQTACLPGMPLGPLPRLPMTTIEASAPTQAPKEGRAALRRPKYLPDFPMLGTEAAATKTLWYVRPLAHLLWTSTFLLVRHLALVWMATSLVCVACMKISMIQLARRQLHQLTLLAPPCCDPTAGPKQGGGSQLEERARCPNLRLSQQVVAAAGSTLPWSTQLFA